MMTIVCDGRCDGHAPLIAKAGYECVHHATRRSVPFYKRDLAHVTLCLHAAFCDGQFKFKRARGGLVLDDPNYVCSDGIRACGGRDGKILCGYVAGHVHGLTGAVRPGVMRAMGRQFAHVSDDFAAGNNHFNRQCRQV